MFDIGGRIRQLRKYHDMTSTELANRMNVSQSFISGLESGTKKSSIDNLIKICNIFDITLSDFFVSESSEILTRDLKELIQSARVLSPCQLQHLTAFLKSMSVDKETTGNDS